MRKKEKMEKHIIVFWKIKEKIEIRRERKKRERRKERNILKINCKTMRFIFWNLTRNKIKTN